MNPYIDELKLNAAATRLASAVYYAKAEAFGGESLHFEALDIATRHDYVQRAAEFLRTLLPDPRERPSSWFDLAARTARAHFATGLRTAESNVIGSILPEDRP